MTVAAMAAFLAFVALNSGGGAAPQQAALPSLSTMDALELYELGDPEVIKLVATPRQIQSIEIELTANAAAWIRANGPREAPRRRMVAATFALEAARHGIDSDGASTWKLIEWASTELRVEPPQPAERIWRIAVITLLSDWLAHSPMEAALGPKAPLRVETALTRFTAHLELSERRFPDEARWIMARAFIAELYAIQRFLRRPPFDETIFIPNDVVQLYQRARKTPAVQAEADIRLGYLSLAGGESDRAVVHLDSATESTQEADLLYLAHLIRGWALTRLGRHDDAIGAFRQAHEAQDDGQTAVLWLANGLFLRGQREEAIALVDQSLRTATLSDPWRSYYRGPFRLWPALIQQLREAIR